MQWWSPDAVRHLCDTSTSIAEMVLRSTAVYLFVLLIVRVAGKRMLAQLSPFDFVVLLILSNTLQNAILGDDNSVSGGIVRAVALIALNELFVRADVWLNDIVERNRTRVSPHRGLFILLERWVDGSARRLIASGTVDRSMLMKEGITVSQLRAALHRQGIRSVKDVARARLEPGGVLYVERKDQTSDAAWRDELVARLTRIEEMLASK